MLILLNEIIKNVKNKVKENINKNLLIYFFYFGFLVFSRADYNNFTINKRYQVNY